MMEHHNFRVRYQVDTRLITTINLSKREVIEFVAGIGGQKVREIYEGERLADPETASGILHAAKDYPE